MSALSLTLDTPTLAEFYENVRIPQRGARLVAVAVKAQS